MPKRFEPASLDWPGSYLEVKPHIYGLELVTDFGLRVLFDGDRKMEIQVPSTVKSHMCGLCGDYDGKWRNDFRKLDGTILNWLQATEFGDSWGVKDDDPRYCMKISFLVLRLALNYLSCCKTSLMIWCEISFRVV